MPEGAFYAFFDVSAFIGREVSGHQIDDDVQLAELLLDEAHCALVPGSAFFGPGHLRMSYATGEEQIERGIARMREVLSR
jgi:aspartate aminotransferase